MVFVVVFLSRAALAACTPVGVGTAVALLIVLGGFASGGSFNPARQFARLVFAERWSSLLPHLAGPLIGGAALALVARLAYSEPPIPCNLCVEATHDLPGGHRHGR